MAKKKDIPWVVAGGKVGELGHCTRCGEGLKITLPQPIPILVAAMDAFGKMHRDCKPQIVELSKVENPWQWMESRDTGVSSATIWSIMMSSPSPCGRYDHPYDPDDFGRCYRLLHLFPDWEKRLPEVAERFSFWTPFVREWSSLAALYEREHASHGNCEPQLYLRLQALTVEAATFKSDEAGRL